MPLSKNYLCSSKLGTTLACYYLVLGNILENDYGITIGIDVETYMGSLYESFDGSNDCKLEGLFIGGSLGSTHGKVIGSD